MAVDPVEAIRLPATSDLTVVVLTPTPMVEVASPVVVEVDVEVVEVVAVEVVKVAVAVAIVVSVAVVEIVEATAPKRGHSIFDGYSNSWLFT